MRYILFATIILISSCESKKQIIANRQQAIKNEMEQVKAFYYKKSDSLQSIRGTDTMSAKDMEFARIAEAEKMASLLNLQKEYDSLEAALEKQ
jgi:hypothetical protein